MKKQLQIISATHAREIRGKVKSPEEWEDGQLLGPTSCGTRWNQMYKYSNYVLDYIKAESSLKVYRIENATTNKSGLDCYVKGNKFDGEKWGYIPLEIHSIHQAETNEELNTAIIL